MGQFKALAGKNWILYKRGIVGSVIEILLPIIFVAFVLLVRKLATVQTIEQQSFVGNNTYDYSLGVNSLNV